MADRYVRFVGRVAEGLGRLEVEAPGGTVSLAGSTQECANVNKLLAAMDGITPIQDDDDLVRQVIQALELVGGVVEPARAWTWFHAMSSNPPLAPSVYDPMAAYSMPRFQPTGEVVASIEIPALSGVAAVANARASADLSTVCCDPDLSFASARRLAAEAYWLRDDSRRPVASGGALYPIHFWVIGAVDTSQMRSVVAVDHDAGVFRSARAVSMTELQAAFVPDDGVRNVIASGAAMIVLATDPSRVVHKYGNRGFRYALMESGAINHHICLCATEKKIDARPVAGFYEERLAHITEPCLPLLAIFVSHGGTGA